MTRIRIFRPAKTATQSGMAKTRKWILEFETGDSLEAEPLMGWVSSKDTQRQLHLQFDDLEGALAYAKSRGMAYTIYNPTLRDKKLQTYDENFTNPRIRGQK